MNKEIFKPLLPPNPVILDIGSFDGKDADELSRMFDCDVHCFEMDADNCSKIMGIGNNRLKVWNLVVGSKIGSIRYNHSGNHPQSSSIKEPLMHTVIFPGVKFDDIKDSYSITLDSWYRPSPSDTIDLIWCDVNGAEDEFIKGATKTLKHTRYLFIEFEHKELFEGALNREQMIKALPDFECIGEYNFHGSYGNLLFKNKNL